MERQYCSDGHTPQCPPGVKLRRQNQGPPGHWVLWRICQSDLAVEWLLLQQKGTQLYSEYTLTFKVGVCIVTTEALGVLAYVATLGARLR